MSDPRVWEIKTTDSKDYYIRACWEARAETPEALAARFLRMIDAFKGIDPVFSLWTCGVKAPRNLELVRDRYAEEVAEGVTRDDWGEPEPVYGYWAGAFTRNTPDDRSFAVRCKGGATVDSSFPNDVTFETSSMSNPEPEESAVSYRVFRLALLAIVDAWDPVRTGAYSRQLIRLYGGDSYFPAAWIQYLCPWLAEKITPPSSVLAEHLPNGGLLMTATTETFDIANPAHIAAAKDMAAAMKPLNEMPWPSRG